MKVACRMFAEMASGRQPLSPADLTQLCKWTISQLKLLAPRVIDLRLPQIPVLIFTDAAYEGGVATWGSVVIDPASGVRAVNAGTIPAPLVKFWTNVAGAQVICQAESFAAVLARIHFRSVLFRRRAILFVDNQPSRFSLIRGTSNSWSMLTLSQEFHLAGEADHSIMWIERVASESNIADLPSRGAGSEAAALIGGRFEGDLEMPIEAMERLMLPPMKFITPSETHSESPVEAVHQSDFR